jgi:hypothetical protein
MKATEWNNYNTKSGKKKMNDDMRKLMKLVEDAEDFPACAECGNVNDDNPGEAMCKTCADWIVSEDCDETPEQGEDGECSPFTHTKDNVDMVHEDYHDEEVQRFYDMGKRELWRLYNETVEENDPADQAALQYMEAALEMHGILVAEGVMDEDFLIPPKDAKYDAEVEEEGEDDEEYDFDSDPLMRGGEDGLGPDGHGYDRDMSDSEPFEDANTKVGREFASGEFGGPTGNTHVGRKFASGEIEEQGPGDDEFDADPDAMVDVGDDEDYEVFDFDDEFDKMMGNTYRFDEEDIVEMNQLRKMAGLKEGKEGVNWKDAKLVSPEEFDERGRRKITKDDIIANGGVIYGHEDEITGGGGTSSRRDGSEFVEMRPAKGFPRFDKWWEEDPQDIMSMVYWQKNQLPPSDPEAFERNWAKVKANLQKKYPAPELTEAEGDTCSRCRKGTMEVGDTFFGPQQRCNHCGFQRAVKESTDSRDDYVAFNFDNEKAYFLVADECGEMMEFGMRDEMLLPDQWVDQVLVLLKDHGFEKGKDFSVAGMEEDLQNGYNDQHSVDHEYDDRFPKGMHSSPATDVGPAGAKHGDNPMRTRTASVNKDEDDIYESYRQQYRRFRRSK